MSEIDPLIVELAAKVDRFEADLKRASRTVDQQLGIQEQRVRKLENQFRSSSAAIGTSLKGLAGTLAAAFTGRELVGLIDSYTRLQNQLRVAGLEGEALANVQERLRAIGRTYGADLESLATTFSRIAQVQGDLGASTEDIIRLNEIVAASLKVAGTDAQTASGALLQLGQAFGSGVVRAEEFNSVLEGALPLAQAAARGIDGYGGSVAKLRAAIAEGKVTSQEFFQGILRGGVQTIDDAKNATLTLSGAFTALRNELTTYVGSNSSATGATGLLSGAIQSLAENLDDVVEALAVIAAAMGVRFVASLGQAALANVALQGALAGTATQMGALGAASFALQARLAGAATTTEALTFAMRGLSAVAAGSLLAGLAVLAVTTEDTAAATERLTQAANEAEATAATYANRLRDAGVVVDNTGKGADAAGDKVAGFAGQLRNAANAALEMADALRVADLAKIGAQLTENRAQQTRLASIEANRPSKQSPGSLDGIIGRGVRDYVVPLAEKITGEKAQGSTGAARQIAELKRQERALQEQARLIAAGAAAGVDVTKDRPASASVRPSRTTGARSNTGAPSGPSAADLEARFQDELASIQSRVLSARATQATSAEQRANFEREQLRLVEESEQRRLAGDKDLTDAQRAQLFLRLSALGNAERQAIAFREQAEIEQRNSDLADEKGRAETDALRLQFDLATTDKDRRRIAFQILDAEQRQLREKLLAQINSKTLNDVDKERARIALAALDAQAADQKAAADQQYASPLKRYANNAKDADKRVEEAAVQRIEQLNETITDAMTRALGIKDPFLSQLIRIFLDKNVFGPLAEALQSQGGGGGFLGSLLQIGSSLFGRASGGRVSAGSIYRVNEGASPGRVEAFRPDVSGQIIPLGRMNAVAQGAAGGPSGTVRVVIEEAPGFAARVRTEATGVAIEVTRQSAPQIIDAAANETFRRASRPGL